MSFVFSTSSCVYSLTLSKKCRVYMTSRMLFRGVVNCVMPEALFGAEGTGYDHIVKKVLTLFVPTKQIPKDMLMGLKL